MFEQSVENPVWIYKVIKLKASVLRKEEGMSLFRAEETINDQEIYFKNSNNLTSNERNTKF